jgi:hypothetical protein
MFFFWDLLRASPAVRRVRAPAVSVKQTQLKKAEAVLDIARRALQNLPSSPNAPEQKEPKPER